jgi:hypothetical protein
MVRFNLMGIVRHVIDVDYGANIRFLGKKQAISLKKEWIVYEKREKR